MLVGDGVIRGLGWAGRQDDAITYVNRMEFRAVEIQPLHRLSQNDGWVPREKKQTASA